MSDDTVLPQVIVSGYPDKAFRFCGEWEKVSLGNKRTAVRNRHEIFAPIYVSDDGEKIIVMHLARGVFSGK